MPNSAEKLQTNSACVFFLPAHVQAHISNVSMWVLVFELKCCQPVCVCVCSPGHLFVKRPLDLSGIVEEHLSTPTHQLILHVVFAD